MTKGVNYPKGPIQWGREMGWDQVLETLKRCHKHYGDDRYRPCPLLRHLIQATPNWAKGSLLIILWSSSMTKPSDELLKRAYAQDASIYQETPQDVAFPASAEEVVALVRSGNR